MCTVLILNEVHLHHNLKSMSIPAERAASLLLWVMLMEARIDVATEWRGLSTCVTTNDRSRLRCNSHILALKTKKIVYICSFEKKLYLDKIIKNLPVAEWPFLWTTWEFKLLEDTDAGTLFSAARGWKVVLFWTGRGRQQNIWNWNWHKARF